MRDQGLGFSERGFGCEVGFKLRVHGIGFYGLRCGVFDRTRGLGLIGYGPGLTV